MAVRGQITIAILFAITAGLFLFFKPAQAIEIQKRFYAKINWRIEPISMKNELRNTKVMGLFLVAAAVLAVIYVLITGVFR